MSYQNHMYAIYKSQSETNIRDDYYYPLRIVWLNSIYIVYCIYLSKVFRMEPSYIYPHYSSYIFCGITLLKHGHFFGKIFGSRDQSCFIVIGFILLPIDLQFKYLMKLSSKFSSYC